MEIVPQTERAEKASSTQISTGFEVGTIDLHQFVAETAAAVEFLG
jgi:hypothetical protein